MKRNSWIKHKKPENAHEIKTQKQWGSLLLFKWDNSFLESKSFMESIREQYSNKSKFSVETTIDRITIMTSDKNFIIDRHSKLIDHFERKVLGSRRGKYFCYENGGALAWEDMFSDSIRFALRLEGFWLNDEDIGNIKIKSRIHNLNEFYMKFEYNELRENTQRELMRVLRS